jgi:hypothetical protein
MKYFEDLVNFKILNEQVPGKKGQTSPEKKQENLPPAQAEVDSYLRDQGIDPNSTTSGFRPFDDFGVKPTPTSGVSTAPASTPSKPSPSSIFGTNPTMSTAMMKSAMKRDRELLARFQRVAERQAEEGTVDKNLQNRINDLQGKIGNPFDPSVPDQLIDYQNRQKQIEMQYGTEATNKINDAEATKKKLQDLEKIGVGKFVGGGRQLFSSGPSFKTAAEEDAYKKAKAAFDFMTTSATEYRGGFGGTRYNPSLRTPEDQKEMERLFDISRNASAEVDRERKNASKISGMYNVTHGDFFNAFGHPYDAMNKDDQRLFFDLNSRLKAGEKIRPFDKPASSYDEVSGTMVRKPPEIIKRELEAENEKIERQAQRIADDEIERQAQRIAGDWFQKETDAAREAGAPYESGELRPVATEPADMAPPPKTDAEPLALLPKPWRYYGSFDTNRILNTFIQSKRFDQYEAEKRAEERKKTRDLYSTREDEPLSNYIDQILDTAKQQKTEVRDSGLSDALQQVINAAKAYQEPRFDYDGDMQRRAKTIIPGEDEYRVAPASPDEGRFERIPEPTLPRQVSTSGAKPLEMPSPTSMGFDREVTSQIPRRAVAAQQPTAQEPRFEYDGDMQRRAKTVIPARTRRKEITRGVGAPINQGINALVAAAQTAGQKLNDYLKVNLAQTMPTTMATKLYGEPETANVPFDNVQRGQFPIDMYYDPEQRTGILDPSIVSRTTMPSYDTRTGEFIVEPRRAFQRNSPLPINVQQFMNRLYRMSR